MKRRDKGEGSIYPKKDAGGKVIGWVGSVDLGYKEGKRRRRKVSGATRKEVINKLAALRRELAEGERPPAPAPAPLLSAFVAAWITDVYRHKVKPKTIESAENALQYYIAPHLGSMPIDRLDGETVQWWISTLIADSYAPATIIIAANVLRGAMAHAVKTKQLPFNPVTGTSLPKPIRYPAQFLSVTQARALLDAAAQHPRGLAIRLALTLGLRRGEVLGLRWADLIGDRLTIRGNLQYVARRGMIYDTPKTTASGRVIVLPPAIVVALGAYRVQQDRQRAAKGDRWRDEGYIFASTTTGGATSPSALLVAFKTMLSTAGLDPVIRFHDLRHSCASFLAAEKFPIKYVSALLGHSSIKITADRYQHLFAEALGEAASAVDELLDGARKEKN